jgi:hypothetical protein
MKHTLPITIAIAGFIGLCTLSTACHKTSTTLKSSDSHLQVTADITTGTVANGHSTDTFLVALSDPSTADRVPLVLHLATTSICREGRKIDDSTYYDTVDISGNKVAGITVVAANGDSTGYGVAIPYVCSHYSFNNWNAGPGALIPSPVLAVEVSGNSIYAGTYGGLCVSTNDGANFTTYTTANGLGDNQVNGIALQGGTIYAATKGGLSVSTDGGSHFTNYTTANGLGDNVVYGVVVNGNAIYAATAEGVSISSDGGETYANYGKANGLAAYPIVGVSVPSGNTIYAATPEGLSVSVNNGVTFTNFTTSNGLGDNQVNAVSVQGAQIFAATLNGLSYSSSGGQLFTTSALGLINRDVYCEYIAGNSLYLGTGGGLGISIGNGTIFSNYSQINGLGTNPVWSLFAQGDTVYAGTNSELTVLTPR